MTTFFVVTNEISENVFSKLVFENPKSFQYFNKGLLDLHNKQGRC